MDDDATPTGSVLDRLRALGDRGKAPHSPGVLNQWVSAAQGAVGLEATLLNWLVASSVVVATLQRAVDADGTSRFLLKGGTYLQYRMGWTGRATKDVDGIVRGELDEFFQSLDETLGQPWGPLTLERTEVEVIDTPGKVIKPRRFWIKIQLRGKPWRRIKVEVSPDEAGAGSEHEPLVAPDLKSFGLPSPDHLFGIALRYQIAQKLHACTDPHTDPECANERPRDLVDLLLLRDLVAREGVPSPRDLRDAGAAVFAARKDDAEQMGLRGRDWPPAVVAHDHWAADYADAAAKGGLEISLSEAVAHVQAWVDEIDSAE